MAAAVLAVTATRVQGRWTYEWIGLVTRYSVRRRRWSAAPGPDPAILTAVSPGARIGQIEPDARAGRLDADAEEPIGVVTHEAGLTAVLAIEPTTDRSVPLPAPLALLPMAEAGESPITAQALVEVVPAPLGTLAGTSVEQSYRGLHGRPPPARRHGWIALQAVRVPDRSDSDVQELGTALTSALRRTRRRLTKAGLATRVLDRNELADTIDELGSDQPDAEYGAAPSGAMAEEWAHWRTPSSAQATLSVVGWPDLSDPVAASAFDRLPDAAGVPTVLALGVRRADRGVEVQAVIRLTAATRADVDRAVASVRASAASAGLRLRRLDGEQVHGLAATLPLGVFLR
ncbi:type VII secretion protein EccE [Cryptosporangium minutisporangium]|uniref:type VII secretion protein EccE n=1 Tax=Cryptosporangium minutisporangium TaxID=113569 RepID=UPI0031E70005